MGNKNQKITIKKFTENNASYVYEGSDDEEDYGKELAA